MARRQSVNVEQVLIELTTTVLSRTILGSEPIASVQREIKPLRQTRILGDFNQRSIQQQFSTAELSEYRGHCSNQRAEFLVAMALSKSR
jgi:hypothetical protein